MVLILTSATSKPDMTIYAAAPTMPVLLATNPAPCTVAALTLLTWQCSAASETAVTQQYRRLVSGASYACVHAHITVSGEPPLWCEVVQGCLRPPSCLPQGQQPQRQIQAGVLGSEGLVCCRGGQLAQRLPSLALALKVQLCTATDRRQAASVHSLPSASKLLSAYLCKNCC